MKYSFYSIGKDLTYIGGGEYDSDTQAVNEGLEYASSINKTLNEVMEDKTRRIVWTLRNGFDKS